MWRFVRRLWELFKSADDNDLMEWYHWTPRQSAIAAQLLPFIYKVLALHPGHKAPVSVVCAEVAKLLRVHGFPVNFHHIRRYVCMAFREGRRNGRLGYVGKELRAEVMDKGVQTDKKLGAKKAQRVKRHIPLKRRSSVKRFQSPNCLEATKRRRCRTVKPRLPIKPRAPVKRRYQPKRRHAGKRK